MKPLPRWLLHPGTHAAGFFLLTTAMLIQAAVDTYAPATVVLVVAQVGVVLAGIARASPHVLPREPGPRPTLRTRAPVVEPQFFTETPWQHPVSGEAIVIDCDDELGLFDDPPSLAGR